MGSPFKVEAQVFKHGCPRLEGAAHTGEHLPIPQVCGHVRRGCTAGLLHQLAVDLVLQRGQVKACLQHSLDQWYRFPCRLELLQ